MTIQLSVFLWTIICFCLMMLILNKLLFGPMLRFMDARQARIDRARETKKNRELALQEAAAARVAALEQAQAQQDALNATAAETLRRQKETALAEARKTQAQEIDAFAHALEQESQALQTKLDAGAAQLARAFADRLVS